MEAEGHLVHDHLQRRGPAHPPDRFLASSEYLRLLDIPEASVNLVKAIKNNQLNPHYKPFDIAEKICISVFTAQELIISSVYLWESVRILRVGELVQKKSNRRRIQKLFLANVIIVAMDVITLTLEFSALWGVWCSFKGFGYSVKLKVEFAILNQLRDSVKSSTGGGSSGAYGYGRSGDNDISLESRGHVKGSKGSKPTGFALERHTWKELEDRETIKKTTEIEVRNCATSEEDSKRPTKEGRSDPPSETSSEIEFATKGGYSRGLD